MTKPEHQKINRYGVDFKLRAVQISEQPGVPIQEVVAMHPSLWDGCHLIDFEKKLARNKLLVMPRLDSSIRDLQKSKIGCCGWLARGAQTNNEATEPSP